jgi:hypothetical protein
MPSSQIIRPQPKPAQQPGPQERRVYVRHACNLNGSCQPFSAGSADEAEIAWPAETRDLARGGIGLSVCRRFEPGTVLSIEVRPPGTGSAHFLMARVVRVLAEDKGSWRLGCQFITPLSEDDLQTLMQSPRLA